MPYAAGQLGVSQPTTGKYLGDLKQVSAGTRIGESAQFLVPFHILNLNIVVRHAYSWCVRSEEYRGNVRANINQRYSPPDEVSSMTPRLETLENSVGLIN